MDIDGRIPRLIACLIDGRNRRSDERLEVVEGRTVTRLDRWPHCSRLREVTGIDEGPHDGWA